jgi:hypothetical protein
VVKLLPNEFKQEGLDLFGSIVRIRIFQKLTTNRKENTIMSQALRELSKPHSVAVPYDLS